MLLENETPDMTDMHTEHQEPENQESALREDAVDQLVEQTEAEAETPPAVTEAVDEDEAIPEIDLPGDETADASGTEAQSDLPTGAEAVEADAADVPASIDEPEAVETPEVAAAPEVDGELGEWLGKIDEMLEAHTASQQPLPGASLAVLIQLMEYFGAAEDTLGQIPRVGLVKRTFDALKYKENFSEADGEHFLELLADFNKKRVSLLKEVDDVRAHSSRRKRELIERLQTVVQSQDASRIQEVRAIQDEWKTSGQAQQRDSDELYKQYRTLLDEFYRLREMHLELLEYDRKINLQEKERLIHEAEHNLVPAEEDRENPAVWEEKMALLAEIQQQWKDAGHIPREEMDRINEQYRNAIDRFFEVRQVFVEQQDQLRQANADIKRDILEKMAEFAAFEADRPKDWNDATAALRALQDAWKESGQAPFKLNNELWGRYREICNAFFGRKAEFFRQFDEVRNENLEKKRKLVERAEELTQLGDWEKGARELKDLQQAWKEIGPVPDRHSNKLWKRFREACDAFFESRRHHYRDIHQEEHDNLDAKKALIERVKQLQEDTTQKHDQILQEIKEIQAAWKEIGKVPYKEKDNIWEIFRGEIDKVFSQKTGRREGGEPRRQSSYQHSAQQEQDNTADDDPRSGNLKAKIAQLRKRIATAQEKVDQYSTNILYIAKGKSGDPLRKQIQGEIDREQVQIKEWKAKIRSLEDALRNPEQLVDAVVSEPDDTTEE
ncbi:MAG: hypothetical protein OHK0039_06890 [Bacteroidia bacterium]